MVLTEDEYREAKSDSRLLSLFKLRKVTKSYIIQSLADREIQYIVNDSQHQSKAYRHNCEVIHSPVKYADVEAVLNGTGWDSRNNKPCKPRILPHLSAGTQDGQQLNKIFKLKSQITNLEKTIVELKASVSEKETFVSKVQSARIQQLEALFISEEKANLALKTSNERLQRELNNTLNLVGRLKREKNELMISVKDKKNPTIGNTRMDWVPFGDPYFMNYQPENNCYPTAYKGVSNGSNVGKIPSDASSKMNLRNLLISIGICLIVYKKPELIQGIVKKLVELSRTIAFVFFRAFEKSFLGPFFW